MKTKYLLLLLLLAFGASAQKVSDLPAAGALTGTELFPGVQVGVTKKVTGGQLKTLAVGAGSVSVASGKTATVSNTLRFYGTDSSAINFGAGGSVIYSGVGSLTCIQLPALTGDITSPANSCVTTLGNIPTAVTAAGYILHTNVAAPSTPASGKTSVWADSTSKTFKAINDAGTLSTTVIADTGASNNFLTAISAGGVISKAQPAFSNLSGSATCAQLPAFTGDVTTSAGSCAHTLATVNSNVGTFGSATKASVVTVNGKGLVTAASESTVTPAVGSITGLGTGVATLLAATPSGTVGIAGTTSPTFITPTLGAALATSINGNTITTGTGVLTLGAGKTATVSNTLTFAGTDGSTLNVGTGGTLGTAAYTASSSYALLASSNTFTQFQIFAPSTGGTAAKLGVQQALTLQTQGVPFTLHTSSNVFSGTRDDISYWGYNLVAGDTAARVDLTEVQLKLALESNYNNAGTHFSEFNFDYVSTDGLTNKRPLSWNVNRSTQDSAWTMAGGAISFLNEGNVQEWWLATTAGNANKIVQKAGSSQSGNMYEWRTSTGTLLSAIDVNGQPTFSTITPGAKLTVADGDLYLSRSTAAANEKHWAFETTATTLLGRAWNDVFGSANPWLTVTRSGIGITSVVIGGGAALLPGNVSIGGASLAGYLGIGGVSAQIQGASAAFILQNTSAAANNKIWTAFETNGTQLFGRILNDAVTVGANWITVTRSGTTVTGVEFPNGNVIFTASASPASGAACSAGTLSWDASYIYICTASGAWKRAALTGGY